MHLTNYKLVGLKEDCVGVYEYQHKINKNTVLIGRCDIKLPAEEVVDVVEEVRPVEIKASFGTVAISLNDEEAITVKVTTDIVTIKRDRSKVFRRKVSEFRRNQRIERKKTIVDRVLDLLSK